MERNRGGRPPLRRTDIDGMITLKILTEVGRQDVYMIHSYRGWRPTVGSREHGINIRVPFNAGNLLTISAAVGF